MSEPTDPHAIDIDRVACLIGRGVTAHGGLTFHGEDGEAAPELVILGRVEKSLVWPGMVHVQAGGVIENATQVDVGTLVLAGKLVGCKEVTADLLDIKETGDLRAEALRLPTGGLIQARGANLSTMITMSDSVRKPAAARPGPAHPVEHATVTAVSLMGADAT